MPQIDCICGIFALHGIILHQGKGFVKGFSGFFLQKGKIRRNIKMLPKKRFRFLCILPAWFRRRIRRLCRREKMLAKQATYSREAWRIYTRFACTGRRPDAPCFILLFQKQVKCSRKGTVLFFSLLRKEPKVAQRVATLWTPRDGSKLYRIIFFVLLPSFVPTPVCGATRFFGCFEPVRKGYCTADARPLLFENELLYSKLTEASRIRKG